MTVPKLGDVVVLGQDPTAIAPEGIADIAVEMTITGGRIVYTAQEGETT